MEIAPEVIYLQWWDRAGVTWCVDRVNKRDLEYRLVRSVDDSEEIEGIEVGVLEYFLSEEIEEA